MDRVPIHLTLTTQPDGQQVERYATPAIRIMMGDTPRLIPNPQGQETKTFASWEEAVSAIQRAGFYPDPQGFDITTHTQRPTQSKRPQHDPFMAAVPILIQRLSDQESSVVANAAYALGELAHPEAVDPLIQLLGHEDSDVRKQVAEALAHIGYPALAPLKSSFEQALGKKERTSDHIRLTVMQALLEMSRQRRMDLLLPVLPLVNEALQDRSWIVRAQAALVMGETAAVRKILEIEATQRQS